MTRPIVLIVEDERPMRRVLSVALRSQGYAVLEADTAGAALRSLCEHSPDVMILDLGLPDMDGVELASRVRQERQIPIIVLSARGEEQQQIRALDAGADDYVIKPFRQGELMARLRAALRRHNPPPERREISVGALRVDLEQRRTFVGEREVSLTPTEFKFLELLARQPGCVVTHEHLLREIWGQGHVEDVQYLRVYVKQLRRKIEDDPARPRRIVTALGVGYRLRDANSPGDDGPS